MFKKILFLIGVIILGAINLFAFQITINVPNGFPTIQSAINEASNGDSIIVAPGVYYENLDFQGKELVIGSLFMLDSNQNHISSTIIDGSNNTLDNGGAVVVFDSGENQNSVLTGFTIRGGTGYLLGVEQRPEGGGIYVGNSSPTLKNLIITENSSEIGAGIRSHQSNLELFNIIIVSNNASIGAGVYTSESILSFSNSVIANNISSHQAGGMSIRGGTTKITNTNIVKNKAIFEVAGGIEIWEADVSILNSIIFGNEGSPKNIYVYTNVDSEISINYSLIEDGYEGVGNLNVDPEFIDDDYIQVFDFSPVIGAGNSDSSITEDIFGTPRPFPVGSNPDIGAYENQYSVPVPINPSGLKSQLLSFDIIRLDWEENKEEDVIAYSVKRINPESDTLDIGLIEENFYLDSLFLNLQTNYQYLVQALNEAGLISSFTTSSIRTGDSIAPTTPLLTSVRPLSQTEVLLEWEPNSELDLWKYNIYRGLDSINTDFIGSASKSLNSFIDNSVQNGNRYYYRITAIDSVTGKFDPSYESLFSESFEIVIPDLIGPSKPFIHSINASNELVQISWNPVPDNDVDYYIIYRGDSNELISKIDSVEKGTLTYIDHSVVNTNEYFYAVSGIDTSGNQGEISNLVRAIPFNRTPIVKNFTDLFFKNVETPTIQINISAEGSFDADGSIDSVFWYVENELVSDKFEDELIIPQGTSVVKLRVKDNSGAESSKLFKVDVNSGFRSFQDKGIIDAGVSLISSDYIFVSLKGGVMKIIDNQFDDHFELSVSGELKNVSSIATDSVFYPASTDRFVYSFDKRGIPLWNTPLGGDLQATPTIDTQRDLLYVGVNNNNLFGINRTTGSVKWSYRLNNPMTSPGIILEGKYLLVVTEDGGIYFFDLDQAIINQELAPIGSFETNESLSNALAVDNDGFIYVTTDSGKLFKIEFNSDETEFAQIVWETEIGTGFDVSPVVGYDGSIYVGGNESAFYSIKNIDGSINWKYNTMGGVSTTATINEFGIVYLGDETGRIYALDENGVLQWYYDAESSIGNATAYLDGNIIFTTTEGEVIKIYDGWRYSALVRALKAKKIVDKSPQWGTYQGNFRRSGNQLEATILSNEEEDDEIPEKFTLSQNYPNPFNPSTNIEFGLPETSYIKLIIYNLLGQNVATLVDTKLSPGTHTISFDASRLASGIYIYQLTTDQGVFTKRLTLIK